MVSTLVVFAFLSFFLITTAIGGQYTPEGLYDPEYFVLDNGMDVVLKNRGVTHNAAVRLAVKVGAIDFPCGQKELPHFLEHLLFTGTSKHSEAELEELMEGHGGSWNAYTGEEETTYEIDIYSPNVLFAINMLYEIFTDSQISDENVQLSRDIIHRESEGKPSEIRKWLYSKGVGRNGFVNAYLAMLQGSDIICPTLQTAEGMQRTDIIKVYEDYYVPNNMLLVVVGEFERDKLISEINKTFGSLERKPFNRKTKTVPQYYKDGPTEFTGIFSPIAGSEAVVGLAFRTDGYLSPHNHPLKVIEYYFDTQLYNSLRIEQGLSYSPGTGQWVLDKYGIFNLTADVDLDDMDIAIDALKEEVNILREGIFDPDDIEQAKKTILLSWVQGFETNAGIADYYVSQRHEFTMHGALIDHEERIESVTVEDIQDVASRYFVDNQSAIIKARPQFSHTQFYILIGVAFLMVFFLLWSIIRRVRRKHK